MLHDGVSELFPIGAGIYRVAQLEAPDNFKSSTSGQHASAQVGMHDRPELLPIRTIIERHRVLKSQHRRQWIYARS